MSTDNGIAFDYSPQIRIHYKVVGHAGIPLILLHGFGASLESWKDIQPLLSERHRLYMVDMKGFGNSSKPKDRSYSIADQAEIIRSLVAHLGLPEVVLVGHSYGGSVAMMTYFKLASSPNNRVSRMVLIDAPGYPQRFPFFISVLRAPVLNRVSLNVISSRARSKYILNHIFWNKAAVTEERIHRYAQFFDLPGSHDALIESARQIVPDDPTVLSGRIPDIAVPTMILWGKQDPLISLWQAERLHREIRGSRLEILDNCGHVPPEERPEDSAKLILNFLK